MEEDGRVQPKSTAEPACRDFDVPRVLVVEIRIAFDLATAGGTTNAVFHIVRNARLLLTPTSLNIVVCWGGHAISREEYDYTKLVGYELGLRAMNVCTGCGPGAMKGPMKGAAIGHSKQRIRSGRYVGLT